MTQNQQTALIAGLTIVAIIVGPLLALWLQRIAENRREKRQGRLWIFKTLMMYRATPLAYPYVQALNLIDVSFNANSDEERAVRAAWNTLLDYLATQKDHPDFDENRRTLTATLLAAMGKCLGYEFDEVYLKRHAYQPIGHGKVEEEQHELRSLLLQVLRNDRRIPIALFPDELRPIVLPQAEPLPVKKLTG
jgi:hypothetical protein